MTALRDLAAAGSMPSGQMLGQIEEVAWWALDHGTDHTDSYELARKLLTRVGYVPGEDGADHWQTLLTYLADFTRWNEAGPDWHEQRMTENQWLRMIRDELVAVAGRPT